MDSIIVGAIALVALLFLVILVIAIPLRIRARKREQARAAALAAWGSSLGWTAFPRETQVRWTERLPGRADRGIRYLFSGQRGGRTVGVAEYAYYETTTTNVNGQTQTTTTTHRYLVCVVDVGSEYPAIEVGARGSGSKLWRWLTGPKDTELGVADFDEKFRVSTDTPEMARQLLGPTLVQAHVAGQVPAWSLYGRDLLAYWPGRLEPTTALPALDALLWVADQFGK